jgi:hypothetical protein
MAFDQNFISSSKCFFGTRSIFPGTDVMIFKIGSPKNLAKKLAFLLLLFCKKLILTLFFDKNAIFGAEKWQKSPEIVIITPTPETTKIGK